MSKMVQRALCVHLTFVVFVIVETRLAASGSLVDNLELSNSSLELLAFDVCDYMVETEDLPECKKIFLGPTKEVGRPANLQILEQVDNKVVFGITESEFRQVIVLVPDEGDVTQMVAESGSTIEETYITPTTNYSCWSAALARNGTHSAWLQGPKLLVSNITSEEQKEYVIEVDEHYIGSSSEAKVNFKWNISDSDAHFTVTNECTNSSHKAHIENVTGNTAWYTMNVSFPDRCLFTVEGRHGRSVKEYALALRPVTNASVFASPAGKGWDVRVRWARPARVPRRYWVVLRAGTEQAANVTGNETEVIFHDVTGRGIYNVTVTAYDGEEKATAFYRALFPTVEVTPSSVPVLSSLLALLLLTTMIVGLISWCRRRRSSKLSGIYNDDDLAEFQKKLFSEVTCEVPVSEDRWELRPEKLQLHEVIGEGAFGVVRRGTLTPGKEVAVKMLKDYPSRDEVRSFRAEMELMKSVGAHAHVVSLVGCCSGRRPLIVAEYCGRGDLLSYLRCSWDVMVSKRKAKYYNNNSQTSNYCNDLFKAQEHSNLVINKMYDLDGTSDVELTYVDLLSFCRQIAMGMEFLASNRLVHRDLAARNILVTNNRTLKIADFGLSRDIYQENQYKQKGNGKMPVKWMAIESLTHRIYTTQSDVWSFGVVVWEIVTVGAAPYPGVPPARLPRLLRSGYRMPQPGACSRQLYEVMVSCWRARPRERPTFPELHAALDALLAGACAEQYVALDLDAHDNKPDLPRTVYARLTDFARDRWRRAERSHANHYSSPPAPEPEPAPAPAPALLCA